MKLQLDIIENGKIKFETYNEVVSLLKTAPPLELNISAEYTPN